jgi:hypothetical protein
MARTKKPTAEGKVVDPPHRYKARASFLYHQKNQNRSPRGPEGRGVPRKCDRDINTICKLGKVKEWMAAGGRGANGGMFWYRLHHTKVHTNDPHEVKMICDMFVCVRRG